MCLRITGKSTGSPLLFLSSEKDNLGFKNDVLMERREGIWFLLHAVDDEGGLGEGNPRPLRAK